MRATGRCDFLSDQKVTKESPGDGKDKTVWSLLPRGHRPLPGENLKCLRCTDTAYLGITVAAGLSDHRRTQQVGRQ